MEHPQQNLSNTFFINLDSRGNLIQPRSISRCSLYFIVSFRKTGATAEAFIILGGH